MDNLARLQAPALTVKAMIDLFVQHHVSTLKDSRGVRCLLKNYFPPLHDRLLNSLTVLDVVAWGNQIRTHSTTQADACIKLLRNIINKAIEWELFQGVNVAQRAKISGRRKRSTYIREQEMPKAMQAIMNARYPERLFFASMLILAPRPKELRLMKVQDVKLWREGHTWHGQWTKPASRTKGNREHVVPIPPKLADMFSIWLTVRAQEADWMFPGSNPEKPLSKEGWHNRWDALRIRAGIEHVWLYDLRRTGSTWAVDESGNLAAVSKGMLDHANYQATDHYVQVMNKPIQRMLESHEKRLLGTTTESCRQPYPLEARALENNISEDGQEWPG